MPEVTVGFCGSNGMPFLLQVMPARPRLTSASRPVSRFGPQIDQHQMRVGPAGDDVEPASTQGCRQHLGVLDNVLA